MSDDFAIVSDRDVVDLAKAASHIKSALSELRSIESHRMSAMFSVIADLHEVVERLAAVAARLEKR